MFLSDLSTLLSGWNGKDRTWGDGSAYEPQDETDDSSDTEPASTPVVVRAGTGASSLGAYADRVKARDTTVPLQTQDSLNEGVDYSTPAARTYEQNIPLRPSTEPQTAGPVPGTDSDATFNNRYNVFGEDRAVAEHGFKNRLKQIGRGALLGLASSQGGTPAQILGSVAA